jgi:uncharacterized Zn-finger protein
LLILIYFPGRFHRNMTRPFFHKERLSDFDIFDRHADDAISQLKARLKEGFPVDVQVPTFRSHHNIHSLSLVHRTWLPASHSTPQPNSFSARMSAPSQQASLTLPHPPPPKGLLPSTTPRILSRKPLEKAKVLSLFARAWACTGLSPSFGRTLQERTELSWTNLLIPSWTKL